MLHALAAAQAVMDYNRVCPCGSAYTRQPWLCQSTHNSLVLLAAEVIRDYESQEEQESCAQQLAVQDDWSDTVSSTTTGQRGPEDVLALGPTSGKGGHLSRTSSARFRGKRSS